MVTDTSENQKYPPIKINPKPNRIAKFSRKLKFLDHKVYRFLFIIVIAAIFSLILRYFSLVSLPVFPKSTWSWWNLFFGLLICFFGSSMMSVDFGKFGSIGGGCVFTSDEIKYGNIIFGIGFACQLIGLVLSLFNR